MMSSCGSPLMTLVMYQASVKGFYVRQEVTAEAKEAPESFLHSTLRKFIHSSSTESITLSTVFTNILLRRQHYFYHNIFPLCTTIYI